MMALFVFCVDMSAKGSKGAFKEKVIYVDFRNEIHTIDALKGLAERVAADGFTCMMLEYEATFPFEKHATIQNRYAYTKEEIQDEIITTYRQSCFKTARS